MDKQKILIVDDKDMIGKIIIACLGREYDCRYFDSPKPVLEEMEGGNLPDLIISDIRMPGMRGDEFLHFIKGSELFGGIRMVMLSSEDSTSERIQLLQAGAEDYIVKPFNPMELKIRIEKILK